MSTSLMLILSKHQTRISFFLSLNLYLFVAVSLTALVIANIVALGLNSAQGYIWDAESGENTRSRRFVEPLVYINIGTPSINDIRYEGIRGMFCTELGVRDVMRTHIVRIGAKCGEGDVDAKFYENIRTSFMNVLIVLTLGEFLWALVGTVWTIRGFVTGCLEPDKLSFTDTPLIAVFVVIIITWIGRKCAEIESIEPYTYKCLSYY